MPVLPLKRVRDETVGVDAEGFRNGRIHSADHHSLLVEQAWGKAREIRIVLGAAERPQVDEFVSRMFIGWWLLRLRYQRQSQCSDDQRQLQVIEMMFCIHNF